jgi:iron complex transport system ATP-binding protein
MLSIQSLTAGYPRRPRVLQNINGGLSAGTLTAWVGPNATGKSTLLRTCLGLLSPEQGTVRLNRQDIARTTPGWRARRLAYVPQRAGMHFAYTARQVVAMGRHGRPDEQAIDEAIDRCDLHDLPDRPFNELSGGQQRLVLIARAWAQSRGFTESGGGLLLADEPTAGLDLEHAERVMRLLRAAADEGLAAGVVLHDLNHAARFADAVWLMHHGQVVAQGPPDEVLVPGVLEPVYGVKIIRLAGPPAVLAVGVGVAGIRSQ